MSQERLEKDRGELTFKPRINRKSVEMLVGRENRRMNRTMKEEDNIYYPTLIIAQSPHVKEEEQHSFHPKILKKSAEIV